MSKMEIYYNTSLPVGDDIESGRPCSIVYFDKKGNVTHQEDHNLENIEISKSALESLARALLPDIQEYFSSEEGKKAFEELNKQKEQDCKRKRKVDAFDSSEGE